MARKAPLSLWFTVVPSVPEKNVANWFFLAVVKKREAMGSEEIKLIKTCFPHPHSPVKLVRQTVSVQIKNLIIDTRGREQRGPI